MFNFLDGTPLLLQGFWLVAVISSGIFLIQTLLTFIGGDAFDGVGADFDGNLDGVDAPFQLFSLRNLINFLLGFGWTGIAFYHQITNKTLLIFLAFGVGIIFILLFFFLISQILKLTEDNTFKIESLIGKTGEVYLKIPPKGEGLGKVSISVNGSSHELSAITRGEELIPFGTPVKVENIENRILIVSKI